jgi:hypothetical protein
VAVGVVVVVVVGVVVVVVVAGHGACYVWVYIEEGGADWLVFVGRKGALCLMYVM